MKKSVHGADVDIMCLKYGIDKSEVIDFSSNINIKTPFENLDIFSRIAKNIVSYPDIDYNGLTSNISRYLGVEKSKIITGNGATEIIYLAMKSIPERIMILYPTFSEYERAARLCGKEIIKAEYSYTDNQEDDFMEILKKVEENIERFDTLFICNPNNPDSILRNIDPLISLLIENDKYLMVDETFIEFSKREKEITSLRFLNRYEKLIVIRAATKFFGIPGIRLGYGVVNDNKIIENMFYLKEPWSVNCFADGISDILFSDSEFILSSKEYYENERKRMADMLGKINHIRVFKSESNFMLIKVDEDFVADKYFIENGDVSGFLKEEIFKKYKILVRDCSNFGFSEGSYIRVAVKTPEMNDRLVSALQEVMS